MIKGEALGSRSARRVTAHMSCAGAAGPLNSRGWRSPSLRLQVRLGDPGGASRRKSGLTSKVIKQGGKAPMVEEKDRIGRGKGRVGDAAAGGGSDER